MKSIEETLAELFSNAEFFESIKNLSTIEEIKSAVEARGVEVTEDQLMSFLSEVSGMMDAEELDEKQLDKVAGGGWISGLALAGIVYGIAQAGKACYEVGTGFGKFVYNIRH